MGQKQLTMDTPVVCTDAAPFPGDALDPDEVNYENVKLVSEDGEMAIELRAVGDRQVRYFARGEKYKVRFERVEPDEG